MRRESCICNKIDKRYAKHQIHTNLSIPNSILVNLSKGSDRSYWIRFGALDQLNVALNEVGLTPGRGILVSDEHVAPLYAHKVADDLRAKGWNLHSVEIPAGESSKSSVQLQKLYDAILPWGIDRDTVLFAIGGGVVGDLAGFAAATLLRGIPLVHIPTSLVAQVDSAIGGKTGINHSTGKNLIGSFYQPRLVYMDPTTLQTLPEREWTAGLAEVVKSALIASPPLFSLLASNWSAIIEQQPDLLNQMIPACAQIKADIVTKDEREAGVRAWLNFGHTFGHALERATHYTYYRHGEAVALGMQAALYASGALHPRFNYEPALRLVQQIPAPEIPQGLDTEVLIQAMQSDKKRRAGKLRYVLLEDIGHTYVTDALSTDQVRRAWEFVRR